MTINKSQGQSLKRVGLFLPDFVFTHGQMYITVSRVTSLEGLKVFINSSTGEPTNITQNVVFKEIFYNLSVWEVYILFYVCVILLFGCAPSFFAWWHCNVFVNLIKGVLLGRTCFMFILWNLEKKFCNLISFSYHVSIKPIVLNLNL